MKVRHFNTIDACNVPRPLSLVDPFNGETLLDEEGNTLDIMVYGLKSDVARNAIKARDRKWGKRAELSEDEAQESGAEYLAALTHSVGANIETDRGPVKTHQDKLDLYKEEDWIAQQVINFSNRLANYDPKRWGKSGRGSNASAGSTQSQKGKSAQEGKSLDA